MIRRIILFTTSWLLLSNPIYALSLSPLTKVPLPVQSHIEAQKHHFFPLIHSVRAATQSRVALVASRPLTSPVRTVTLEVVHPRVALQQTHNQMITRDVIDAELKTASQRGSRLPLPAHSAAQHFSSTKPGSQLALLVPKTQLKKNRDLQLIPNKSSPIKDTVTANQVRPNIAHHLGHRLLPSSDFQKKLAAELAASIQASANAMILAHARDHAHLMAARDRRAAYARSAEERIVA